MNGLLKLNSVNNAVLNNQGMMPAQKIYMYEQGLFSSFCYVEKQDEIVIYIGLWGIRIHELFTRQSLSVCLSIRMCV